jgi:hypothetical protein
MKIMTMVERIDAGTPVLIKSRVRRYGFPVGSSIMTADMFGYPETGNPVVVNREKQLAF